MSDTNPSNGSKTRESEIVQRRQPVQARSRERVERILDAATQLLAEQGYDAVKTNAIARRAGVSIGSVYQFFPNRFAIFNALAEQYREKVAKTLNQYLVPGIEERSWEEALEETMDILADMWRTDWAFHSVWLAIQNTAELRDARDAYRDALLDGPLSAFLRPIMPKASDAVLRSVGRVILETSNILLDLSLRDAPSQDPLMVDELKFLLHSYVDAHVRAANAGDGSTF